MVGNKWRIIRMLNPIKNLFEQLESADLDLLINIQGGIVPLLEPGLRRRARCLDQIQTEMSVAVWQNDEEKALVRTWQERALERNKRIVSQMRSLYTAAKGEFLKCRSGHLVSPYKSKKTPMNRIRA